MARNTACSWRTRPAAPSPSMARASRAPERRPSPLSLPPWRSAMHHHQRIAVLAASLCLATAAMAAGNPRDAQAQHRYQQERAHCTSGHSQQDRATCLKEAAAAYQEARRGALANPAGADLAKNATTRCEAQPRADREECVQRIMGAGNTEGSVNAGGVIRHSET